jgi:hypothetical protein
MGVGFMRKVAKISFLFLSLFYSETFASPTVVGLDGANPNPDSSLFTDTTNRNLLWVTPPRTGALKVSQKSLAVDEATCRSVAAINARRLARLSTGRALQEQQTAIENYRNAVINQAMRESWSADRLSADMLKLDQLVTDVSNRIRSHDSQAGDDKAPSYLYESAGYYSFVAQADWAGAVTKVKSSYSTAYTVNAIPTTDVSVFVSVIGADGFKPNELVARTNIGNFANLSSVVDGLQVDVEPTKIGACFINFPQVMGGEAAAFPFGMSINYTYNMAITTKVTASYNLRDIYTYVSRSGKSGGFFSSRSWKEVTESRDVDELFHLKIEFEHNATPAEEEAERFRVKEYLLGYAISDMVKRSVPDGPLGKTGALVASETLMKTCGANAYCAGAAAGLAVLDGIFGKNSTSTTLTQSLDVTRTYDSGVTKAVPINAAISFTTKP